MLVNPSPPDARPRTAVPVGLSPTRYAWRWLTVTIETRPRLSLASGLVILLIVGLLGYALGGFQRPTWRYAARAFAVWKLQTFGGEQSISRAINVFDEMLIFQSDEYDQLDIAATSLYVTGTAFQQELKRLIDRGGQVRILVLDPRLADGDAQQQARFADLAAAFGQPVWSLRSECLHSTAVLLQLRDELGPRFHVRVYDRPTSGAQAPYLLPGRSYHRYDIHDPGHRLDILVPYRGDDAGLDANQRSAWRLKDRADSSLLAPYLQTFADLWDQATPIEQFRAELGMTQ